MAVAQAHVTRGKKGKVGVIRAAATHWDRKEYLVLRSSTGCLSEFPCPVLMVVNGQVQWPDQVRQ